MKHFLFLWLLEKDKCFFLDTLNFFKWMKLRKVVKEKDLFPQK